MSDPITDADLVTWAVVGKHGTIGRLVAEVRRLRADKKRLRTWPAHIDHGELAAWVRHMERYESGWTRREHAAVAAARHLLDLTADPTPEGPNR